VVSALVAGWAIHRGSLTAGDGKIVLCDFQRQKFSSVSSGYPGWSRDGESWFYRTWDDDGAWWRVRLRNRKTERVAALKNWSAQAPDARNDVCLDDYPPMADI